MKHDIPHTPEGVSSIEQLSIRMNQLIGLFDRFPLPTAICYTEGFELRVVNPTFSEAVSISRDRLRGRRLFDVVTARNKSDVESLSAALHRRQHARFPIPVQWTASGRDVQGQLTVELVDETLIGPLPLLLFLHITDSVPTRAVAPHLEPIARKILTQIAGGATTAATARSVGLTADGVNYHIARMCRSLNASNRVALVARAYVLGVLDVMTWPPTPKE